MLGGRGGGKILALLKLNFFLQHHNMKHFTTKAMVGLAFLSLISPKTTNSFARSHTNLSFLSCTYMYNLMMEL